MSKRMKKIYEQQHKITDLDSIISAIKSSCTAKFDESIDLTVGLGINPKKSDENVRTIVNLAKGLPSKKKVMVFCEKEDAEIAKKAGADFVGLEDLIEKIKNEKAVHVDICLTTPDLLKMIAPIAKILGQAKVMPNVKDGTVTKNLKEAIEEIKSGTRLKIKNDSAGYVSCSIGKKSFDNQSLESNIKAVINHLSSIKPPKVKTMIKKVYLSSTMGAGIEILKKYL